MRKLFLFKFFFSFMLGLCLAFLFSVGNNRVYGKELASLDTNSAILKVINSSTLKNITEPVLEVGSVYASMPKAIVSSYQNIGNSVLGLYQKTGEVIFNTLSDLPSFFAAKPSLDLASSIHRQDASVLSSVGDFFNWFLNLFRRSKISTPPAVTIPSPTRLNSPPANSVTTEVTTQVTNNSSSNIYPPSSTGSSRGTTNTYIVQGVSESELNQKLQALNNSLSAEIYSAKSSTVPVINQYITYAGGGNGSEPIGHIDIPSIATINSIIERISNLESSGTNPFDQSLNTTDSPTFNSLTATSINTTNLSASGTIQFSSLVDGCLELSLGVVVSTGVNCGSGGGGITSLNGQTGSVQTFATSSTGTNFSITSSGNVHTFNLPSASASNRGLLTSADWTTFNNKVSSVFGRTGAVTAQSGDYTTSLVTEGSNLYYTDARARGAISSSAAGLTYTSGSGVFSLTSGFNIPLTASTTDWQNFFTTPSSRITAGSGLSWSGNTLNASSTVDVTLAGENYLSLSGQQITANAVNLSGSNATGTLAAARFPALTGDVTTSAGSLATVYNGVVPAAKGGTGLSVVSGGDLLAGSSIVDGSWTTISAVATGNALISSGPGLTPAWGKIGLGTHVSGTLPVANGGTGQTTYTSGQLLIGSTIGNTLVKATLTGTSNQIVITNGAGTIQISTPQNIGTASSPTFAGITLSNFTSGSVPFFGTSGVLSQNNSNFFWDNSNGRLGIGTTTPGSELTVVGNGLFTGTITASNISGTNSGTNTGDVTLAGENYLSLSGQQITANAVNLSGSNATGTLAAARFPALTGDVTTSAGSLATVYNGVVPINKGGTNLTTYATGDLIYATSSNVLGKRTIGATGTVLSVVGGVPTWVATSTLGLGGGGGSVSSVSNSDGSLTISPTTGSVVASLNTGNANIFTAVQQFGSGAISLGDQAGTAAYIDGAHGAAAFGDLSLTIDRFGNLLTSGTITGSNLSGTNTGDQTITLTGDITGSGTGSFATTYNGIVPVIKGGTGQTTYTNGQLLIGNTTGNTLTKATLTGTSNQVVVTNGAGSITLSTPQSIGTASSPTFAGITLSNFTSGSIPFFGTSGVLSQNNSNFFWDNSNGRLGIGTTTPSSELTVVGNGLFTGTITASNISGTNTGDQTITLTGDITGSGTGSFATTYNGIVPTTKGGTGLTTYAAGDLIYATSSIGLARRTIGTIGDVLSVVGGLPTWVATSTLGISGAVTSVSNSDGTLTISPTTGAVVASLALGHANTWTGQQTFNTSAPIFGTMTAGSALFAGTAGLLSQDNANFFYDGTNHRLGLGTTTPNSKLTIAGAAPSIELFNTNASGRDWQLRAGGAGAGVLDFYDNSSSTSRLAIDSAGNVGIGTTNPTAVNANGRLVVAGTGSQDIIASTTDNTTLSDAIIQAYAPGSRIFMGAHGTNQVSSRYGITLGGWGEIGAFDSTSGTTNGLIVGTNTATPLVFGTNNIERIRINSSGNVGIGTTTQAARLTIVGAAGSGDAFQVASSSGSTVLSVGSNGTLVLGNLSADPATASNGATYYNTTTNSFRCYVNSVWQQCDTDGAKMLRKTADQIATSSNTTVGNDSELFFALAANSTYYIEASIDVDISATGIGFKYTFTIPGGGATINLQSSFFTNTTVQNWCNIISSGSTCGFTPAGALRQRVPITGIVTTSGTTGNLQFQFSQNTSSGSASPTVKAGSWIRITNSANTGGADLAEYYSSRDATITSGDLVSLDPTITSGVAKSTTPYDRNVLGVVSTHPGLVLGINEVDTSNGLHPVPLALQGRVPVKVSTENGDILPGDYLTSSHTPGVAMKATEPGFVFGQALTGYSGEEPGTVSVFLKHTFYYDPNSTNSGLQILKSVSDPNAEVSDYHNYGDALDLINRTTLHSFTYKDSKSSTSTISKLRVGFAIDEADPLLLSGNSIDQGSVNGLLIASVKALDIKINNVTASSNAITISTNSFINDLSLSSSSTLSSINTLNDHININTLAINHLTDLYASTTAALNTINNRIDLLTSSTTDAFASIEIRVSSLENLGLVAPGDNGSSLGAELLSTLQSFGSEIVDGISYLKNVFVQHFTAQNLTIKGKDVTKTGFTIYDRVTGAPICVYFENGMQKTSEGECPDSTSTSTPNTIIPDDSHNIDIIIPDGSTTTEASSSTPAEESASTSTGSVPASTGGEGAPPTETTPEVPEERAPEQTLPPDSAPPPTPPDSGSTTNP